MIEIIREESWDSTQEKSGLPKNIKQIGTPDIGERIYIENNTYQYMHSYRSSMEKNAYVLLGRFEEYGGRKCTFIEAAILLEEICFDGALPVWNDETWAYLYRRLNHAYDEMVIVGWAMDIRGQLPNLTAPLEKLHRTYFGGMRQLLFLMDSLEGEENFYTQKNGRLSRRDGYYIYYDRSIPERLDTAMEMLQQEKEERARYINENQPSGAAVFLQQREDVSLEKEDAEYQPKEPHIQTLRYNEKSEDFPNEKTRGEARNSLYRDYIKAQAEKKLTKPAYSSTLLLAAVALALGAAAFRNYEKMNEMEETLAKMNASQTTVSTEALENSGWTGSSDGTSASWGTASAEAAGNNEEGAAAENGGVKIETVSGSVSKSEEEMAGTEATVGQSEAESDKKNEEGGDEKQSADNSEEQTADSQTQNTETAEDKEEQSGGSENQKDDVEDANAAAENGTSNQTESSTASETAETMTESQQYLSQGYYIVQKGESLVGICKKIYQTTAMMDKLCEVNEIDDPDEIYAGQKLILPN